MEAAARESLRPGSGTYLYGVVSPAPHETILAGIETPDGSDVRSIGDGRFDCVVRTVAADRYDQSSDSRITLNLEALGAEVRHHEEVLERLMEDSTVLPSKFGLVYRDDQALFSAVLSREDEVLSAFARLERREEWGLRLWARKDRLSAWLEARGSGLPAPDPVGPAAGEGRAFLQKRKRAEMLERLCRETILEVSREIRDPLRPYVEDARAQNTATDKKTEDGLESVFNLACLVRRENRDEFLRAAESSASAHAEHGFHLRVTGPWPPYNFLGEAGAAP
jgi:hypothetical protein